MLMFCFACFCCRVSLTPAVAAILTKKGFQVKVEKGAGHEAKFRDADYAANGAAIVDRNSIFESGRKFAKVLSQVSLKLLLYIVFRHYPESPTALER